MLGRSVFSRHFVVALAAHSYVQALGINFATFTPEVLLHVGRVTKCDEELVVELAAEPGSAELSFGGVVEEEGGAAEETFQWVDVLQGDWRLVSA